jgi:4-amino-4-deoxy-L-arabinose transferase-like glycosyltransferase
MLSADSPASTFRRALWLVLAVLVGRLAYAAIFAVNPAGDEAYYWDWGRRPDYGYYSKPPFIAWLYALVDWLGSGSLFGIRAAAAVLGTGSLLILHRLAAELFDERTAWYGVLLGLAAPANAVLSFFLTIDAPLVVCWSTALWMFWRIVSGRGGIGAHLALFAALATGHLCKQMMMVFPVLAVFFLASAADTRDHLRRPGLWAGLFGSYLSLVPPLVWNSRHDWITFRHTRHHFETGADGGNPIVERLGDFASFLGTQLGVLSPGTAFVVFSLCLAGLPLLRRAARPHRFLLVFGALPLAGMILLALRQEIQPNWAAVFYLSGILLAAAWYAGRVEAGFPPASWRRLFPVTLSVGFLLVGYFYLASPLFEATGRAGHTADPNRRLIGYEVLAARFEAVRNAQPDPEKLVVIALGHRDLASQLAFGLPDHPRVYRWEPGGEIVSQYEMWNDPVEDGLTGSDALILAPGETLPARFARGFERTEPLGRFTVPIAGQERVFSVHRGLGLTRWPEGNPPNPQG